MRTALVILAAACLLTVVPVTGLADDSEWTEVSIPSGASLVCFFNDTIYARTASRLYTVEDNEFTELLTPEGKPVRFHLPFVKTWPDSHIAFVAGGLLGSDGKQHYLVTGKEVARLEYDDGSPVIGTVTRHPFGAPDCPYLCVGRDLIHVTDGKASKVDLPKEVVVPQVAKVDDTIVLAASNKFWILDEGKVKRVKDTDGNEFSEVSSVSMSSIGAYLLVSGIKAGQSRELIYPYLLDGDVLEPVKLEEEASLLSFHKVGNQVVFLVESSLETRCYEPHGTKLKEISALSRLKIQYHHSFRSYGTHALITVSQGHDQQLYIYEGKKVGRVKVPKDAHVDKHVPFLREGDTLLCTLVSTSESSSEKRWYTVDVHGEVREVLHEKPARQKEDQKVGDVWHPSVWVASYGVYATRYTITEITAERVDRSMSEIFLAHTPGGRDE